MSKWLLIALTVLILAVATAAQESCTNDSCSAANNSPSDLVSSFVNSTNEEGICIIYFYGQECSKCAETKPFLEELEKKYQGQIHITKFEVYHNLENYQLYNKYCLIQSISLEQRGIPLVAIGNKFFMGATQIRDNQPILNLDIVLLLS